VLGHVSIRSTLSTCFARPRVDQILHEMVAQGLTKRPGPWSPHNAAISLLAVALLSQTTAAGALKLAQRVRDWKCCGPDEKHRWQPGMGGGCLGNMSLAEIRLSRVMCMQIYLQRPTDWQISEIAAIGNGLYFSQGDYGGPVPERIKRTWTSVPYWVLEQYGRQHGLPRDGERVMNEQLSARIERAVRPVPFEEAAE
jgi:hypothetical protein